MIKLSKIKLKNFLSVGAVEEEINLNTQGLTLILGDNLDTPGLNSRNGTGKTTILQAIVFALFGQPLTQIRKDNLVNKTNEKNMEVSLEFEKNKNKYKIERGRKPNYIRWYVNDGIVNSPDTDEAEGDSKWTQKEIEQIIGMSLNMFRHIVALNTYTIPFLNLRSNEQRQIIEDLLGINALSEKADGLKLALKETKDEIRLEENSLEKNLQFNEQLQENINLNTIKKKKWTTTQQEKIDKLKNDIELISHINFDSEIEKIKNNQLLEKQRDELASSINSVSNQVKELISQQKLLNNSKNDYQSLIDEIDANDFSSIESNISRNEKEIKRKQDKIKSYSEKIEELQNQLNGSDNLKCTTCDQALSGTEHLDTVKKNLTSQIEKESENISIQEVQILEIENDIGKLHDKIEAEKEKNEKNKIAYLEKISEFESKLQTIDVDVKNKEPQILELESSLQSLPELEETDFENDNAVWQMKSIYTKLQDDLKRESKEENPFLQQIENLEKNLQKINYDNLNQLKILREHQEFLFKLLTNRDSFIRKKIIDQNISYLNHCLSKYLDELGLPHQVTFQSDLSVEIIQIGREFDFDQLSRGERNRLILGLSWAFRDVWESINGSINLLFIDELMDSGIDTQGAENALIILKAMARDQGKDVFLISHKDELINRVNNVLLVQKENGFTTFHNENEDNIG